MKTNIKKFLFLLIPNLLGLILFCSTSYADDLEVPFKPPEVDGADWKTNPVKYIVYGIFMAGKIAAVSFYLFFIIQSIRGVKTSYSEYMSSRFESGEGNNSKLGGTLGYFIIGTIVLIIVYGIILALETAVKALF